MGRCPICEDFDVVETPTQFVCAERLKEQNDRLRLYVDQFARASSIAGTSLPDAGVFLILVVGFEDLESTPVTVDPSYISLSTSSGALVKPQSIDLHSAIEDLHRQIIDRDHGTVGLVCFPLSSHADFDELVYDDGMGDPLEISLKP